MRKRNGDVLFLCQFFYPEYNSSATLPWDTAKYLAEAGFSVGAMCGYPKEYNSVGTVPDQETQNCVKIKRLHYIQLKRGKKISRLINYFSFTFKTVLQVKELRNYKCVIVYSNPPILPVCAVWGNVLYGTRIVFVSYDVYPEVAYTSGSLAPEGLIARMMKRLNRSLFNRASAVVALTDEMKTFLVRHRGAKCRDKIRVIPNWAHEGNAQKNISFYEEFGYKPEDFIIAYFGNMGICQDIKTIIECMLLLKDEPDIQFLVAGHGRKVDEVKRATRNIKNVRIIGFKTGEKFEKIASICTCGVVSPEKGLQGMCAPSKYYSYLQCGMPVVTIVERGSYLDREVAREKIGISVENGQSNILADELRNLSKNKNLCHEMSIRAKRLYEEKYAKKNGLNQYVELISEVVKDCD